MGFGASLAFIAIGAIVAFATRFELAGINVQLIGLILMGVGIVGMIVTFTYTRPRRRGQVTEVIEEEPGAYLTHPDDPAPHVIRTRKSTVEQRGNGESRPVPGRHLGDGRPG
jgi:uncharacterized protein DUF6458